MDGIGITQFTHRIWVQGDPPDEYRFWLGTWETLMPDWEHRLWSESDYYPYLTGELKELYDSSPHYAQKSDIAGKVILYRHGGVMMCADFECFRHMGELFDGKEHVVAWWESPGQMSNGIIGAPPHHPAVGLSLDLMPASLRAQRERNMPINYGAGPMFIHQVWHGRPDVEVRPAGEVYPYLWTQPKPASYGDAYAAHHWKATWKT